MSRLWTVVRKDFEKTEELHPLKLTTIYNAFEGAYSYEKIRFALAYLQKQGVALS